MCIEIFLKIYFGTAKTKVTYKLLQSTANMTPPYRRVYLVELLVLGDGVVDPFLDRLDVLLIVQVTGGLPSYLDPPGCRQSCQVHSCSRLKNRTYVLKRTEVSHVGNWLFKTIWNVVLQQDPAACSRQRWSVCADQTEHSCSEASAYSSAECAARIPWKAASLRWRSHSLLPELSFSDDTVWKVRINYT